MMELSSTIYSYIDALDSAGKLEGYGSGNADSLIAEKVHLTDRDKKVAAISWSFQIRQIIMTQSK